MSKNNSNSSSTAKTHKAALDRFKTEVASELGINLKEGYNGDLTAKQAGSIGGQMVNNICPVRHMNFTRNYRTVNGHQKQFTYSFRLVV